MPEAVKSRLASLLSNPHTSGAAFIYIAAKAVAVLGAIWLPTYKAQFQDTAQAIESLAVAYGFIMAGDAGADKKTNTPDTK